MNSFRFTERGIEPRSPAKEAVASGGQVVQETLHFDPATGSSLAPFQEEAHDYRLPGT